jgi:3D (Asp-Asp-Asp) domain-containing protein
MFLAAGISSPVPQNQTQAGPSFTDRLLAGKRLRFLEVPLTPGVYLARYQQLNKMIRYLYSIGSLVLCVGFPLQAKDIARSLPSSSSIAAGKGHSLASTASQAKENDKTATVNARQNTKASSPAIASVSNSRKQENPGSTVKASSSSAKKENSSRTVSNERLARVTAYWAGEGDYYTSHGLSSTGVRLHGGHCAVDPRVIPYGSVVKIAGVGAYLAVDTGSAVISREAARETGHTSEERNALVIDLFFESRHDGEKFAATGPKFASITWETPHSADNESKESHSLYASQ